MRTGLIIPWALLPLALVSSCGTRNDEPAVKKAVLAVETEKDAGAAKREQVPTLDEPKILVDLEWGSGGWTVGRFDGNQAASAGPMSFCLSPAGDIYILDQIQARVLVFFPDGSPSRQVPLPAAAFNDILALEDGTLVLLDRDARGVIVILDGSGDVRGEHAVEGPGIERAGRVTATYALEDGIWLEVHHETMVHVLDAGLSPCERTVLAGLPCGTGGTRMRPARIEAGGAVIRIEDASGNTVREKKIYLDHPIERIAWTDTDAEGRVYALLHLLEYDGRTPPSVAYEGTVGMVFDGELNLLARIVSPHVITSWWQLKEFEVTPDGRVLQLALTERGAQLLEWRVSW
jgi:hypothetical protein